MESHGIMGRTAARRGSFPEDVARLRVFAHRQRAERRPGRGPAGAGADRLPAETAAGMILSGQVMDFLICQLFTGGVSTSP